MADQKEELIETFDEQGNKVSFELVDIVTVDDIEYALLLPVGIEDNSDDEEEELLVMRLKKEGEEFSFEVIDDDDELNKVAQYIEELEDEIDD